MVEYSLNSFIPLIKPTVGKEELKEIEEVISSGWLSQGPKVREFENKLADYLGAKHVIATSSCTTAMSLAIEALALRPKSKVIVPDFTFPATGNVVVRGNCTPVIADVRPDNFSIDPAELGRTDAGDTSAVLPVHPFGHPFELDEVYEWAVKNNSRVIEDAATAIGTKYKKRKVGSSGAAICFSFHPRKLLTTGEGGCLVTDDDEIDQRARAFRSHGQVSYGVARFVYNGLNYRMSDVNAAIGIAQLAKLDRAIVSRRRMARTYSELLKESRLDVQIPTEAPWGHHVYQSYVVVLGRQFRGHRDDCIRRMKDDFKVETQVGTYSMHMLESFRNVERLSDLRSGEALFTRSLTLPLFEGLTDEDQGHIVSSLKRVSREA